MMTPFSSVAFEYHPLRDSSFTEISRAGLIWHHLMDLYASQYDLSIRTALDLGTGFGHIVTVGSQRFGIDVIGMDLRRAVYQGPAERFVEHDIMTPWPFASGRFDLVLECLLFDDLVSLQKKQKQDVTSHLSSEIDRVVRKRGYFFSHSSSSRDLILPSFELLADDRSFRLYQKRSLKKSNFGE